MALDATPGGSASNAYCTVAQATAYLAERLQVAAWYPTTPGNEGYTSLPHQREAALLWATQLLDTHVRWRGKPTTLTQALAWPQTGQVDAYGRAIDPTIIPQDIQRATAYYALALMEEAQAAQPGSTLPGATPAIKRKRIGQTEIEYQAVPSPTTVTTKPASQRLPAEVQALLKPYGFQSTVAIALART